MKLMKSKAGFTLIELLATLLIVLILTSGIVVSMDAGSKVYRESIFVSDSSLLAETLNNHLGDILRNATVTINEGTIEDDNGNLLPADKVGFIFNNSSYGAQSAYIQVASGRQTLVIKSTEGGDPKQLVNTGAYPDLKIEDLSIIFHPKNSSATDGSEHGGYFEISYTIVNVNDDSLFKEVETRVRLLNDP